MKHMARSGMYMKIGAAILGLAVVFMALGIGAFFGSLYSPDKKQYQTVGSQTGASQRYGGPSESLPDIAGIDSRVERIIATPPPYDGQDHEKRDLAAQEAMAVWAFWMVGISAVTLIVSTFGLIALFRTIRQGTEALAKATEANAIAREIGEAQARAHVSVKSAICNITGNYLSLVVDVENSGLSSASEIKLQLMCTSTFR